MTAIGIKNVHCAYSALATVFRSKITQPLSKEIVIFYTEILTGKVVLWCFFLGFHKIFEITPGDNGNCTLKQLLNKK